MTEEEKQLLLIDLCARLPYGVKITTWQYNYCDILTPKGIVGNRCYFNDNPRYDGDCSIDEVKPYLRSMSSMTEEEVKEFAALESIDVLGGDIKITCVELSIDAIDWLNKKMFDYRGLIPMGLALEALEDMYKN